MTPSEDDLVIVAPRRLMMPAITAALRELARERDLELDDDQLLTFGRCVQAAIERNEVDLREWSLRISKFLP